MEPKADPEEEEDPEHGVPLTQSPSGGGITRGPISAAWFLPRRVLQTASLLHWECRKGENRVVHAG